MDLTSPKFATLANELVHQILDDGARQSRQFCVQLSLVCSWARRLAYPHLYKTIVANIPTLEKLSGCLSTARDNETKDLQCIRSCWVVDGTANAEALYRLSDSHSIAQSLVHFSASPIEFIALRKMFVHSSSLHLTLRFPVRKSVALEPRRRGNFDPNIFLILPQMINRDTQLLSHIKSLRLTGTFDYGARVGMSSFTHLTHFAIPFDGSDTQIGAKLRVLQQWVFSVPALEMLVIVVNPDVLQVQSDWQERLHQLEEWIKEHNGRQVLVRMWVCNSDAVQDEWEEEARGGMSLWEKLS